MRRKPSSSQRRSARKPTLAIAKGAPNASKCRAVPIVKGGKSARCISEDDSACKFSKPYGSGRFCEHPDREHIVARTLSEKKRSEAARVKKFKKIPRRSPLS